MRRSGGAVAVAVLALMLGACEVDDDGSTRSEAGPRRTRSASPETRESRPQRRRPTRPEKVGYVNAGLTAADRAHIGRAVRDLEELGFWKELTAHVVRVKIASRPGVGRILEDERLADSIMTVEVTGPWRGMWCDVLIYSTALAEDIEQQAVYYSEGRLSAPPPSLREFWAVILAHELAHCSPRGQRGEAYSTKWEGRVLRALGRARVGSPM